MWRSEDNDESFVSPPSYRTYDTRKMVGYGEIFEYYKENRPLSFIILVMRQQRRFRHGGYVLTVKITPNELADHRFSHVRRLNRVNWPWQVYTGFASCSTVTAYFTEMFALPLRLRLQDNYWIKYLPLPTVISFLRTKNTMTIELPWSRSQNLPLLYNWMAQTSVTAV